VKTPTTAKSTKSNANSKQRYDDFSDDDITLLTSKKVSCSVKLQKIMILDIAEITPTPNNNDVYMTTPSDDFINEKKNRSVVM